jgi:hypothetical protein
MSRRFLITAADRLNGGEYKKEEFNLFNLKEEKLKISSVAGQLRIASLDRRREIGKIYGFRLPALPERRNKAFFKRDTLFNGQMRHRPEGLSAGPAWTGSSKDIGVPDAASGKAKIKEDLWPDGTAI